MARTYEYAVIDGNQAPDQHLFADSCHASYAAAARAAERANARNPNHHYYVCSWGAARWARLAPAPEHYPVAAPTR